MKKRLTSIAFLCFLMTIVIGCSKENEADIPTSDPIPTPVPTEKQDSLFYTSEAAGFELVASTKDKAVAFMQRDTLFHFRCLFDSCQNKRLVAYCDSLGIVERICIEDKVFDFLYHQDRSKLDILYKKDGKLDYINDIANPFKDIATRTESGDVPFSAIHALSNASYGIYTIINTYPMVFGDKVYGYIKKYSAPPFHSELALEYIAGIYQAEYGQLVGNYYAEIASVMRDYATWVRNELYGDAIPLARKYAERSTSGVVSLYAYVNDVDSMKADFRVGIIIQENEATLFSCLHNLKNNITAYDPENVYHKLPFIGLQTGKRYKYRTYLAPLSSSKYLTGAKALVDYCKYGQPHTFDLLEANGNVVSCSTDKATIELSAETIDRQKIKMGVFYGTNPKLPKDDRKKAECNVTFNDYTFSDKITKTVELNNLISDTTYYYMPYIIYDANVVNYEHAVFPDHISGSTTITEEDLTFCNEIKSFNTQEDSECIRSVLTKIYNDCGGKKWYHKKNWLSDKPVTEWEGVTLLNDGTYQFDFFKHNPITGSVIIQNCNEKMAMTYMTPQYYNNVLVGGNLLEELRIENCPNLRFMDGISAFNAKNVYIDNILVTDQYRVVNGAAFIDSDSLTFSFAGDVESVVIKNCRGNFYGISFFNRLPKLKSITLENLTFKNKDVKSGLYIDTSIDIRSGFEGFNQLKDVKIANIKNANNIFLRDCPSLESVQWDNFTNDYMGAIYARIGNSAVNKLTAKTNNLWLALEDNTKINILKFTAGEYNYNSLYIEGNNLSASSLYVKYCNLHTYDRHSGLPVDLSKFAKLKNAKFESCFFSNGLLLNGCTNLETFEVYNGDCHIFDSPAYNPTYGIVDIRNTPQLKLFDFHGDLARLLFDEHFNYVQANCYSIKESQMIPSFYTSQGDGYFNYNARFEYPEHYDESTNMWVRDPTIDHGFGWWYPDEPYY